MKQEAAFTLQQGAFYDNQNRLRFFKGTTITQTPSLEDAPEFFQNLSNKGFNLLLWQLTWDSVEPNEPEEYDEEFLAQLRLVLKYAEDYDISIIMQPVIKGWNKQIGGTGAPDWTLKTIGIDFEKLNSSIKSANAFIQENKMPKTTENPIVKYVKDTMFTLFWAGKDFAEDLTVEGDNIQEYLQTKYIDAMKHTARRIKDCKAVIGFSCMNGAEHGFIGSNNFLGNEENSVGIKIRTEYELPSFEAIKAANGFKSEYIKQGTNLPIIKQTGNLFLSLEKDIFEENKQCPWKDILWHTDDNGNIVLNNEKYFCNTSTSFAENYYKTFQQDFVAAFQKKRGHYIFLSEPCKENDRAEWIVGEYDSARNSTVEKEGGVLPNFDIEASKIIVSYNVPKATKTITGQIDIKDFEKKFTAELDFAKKDGVPAIGIIHNQLNASLKDFFDNHFDSYVFTEEGFDNPYPIALNGKLLKLKTTFATNTIFEMQWESVPISADANPENATEIFIPKELFLNGWKVELFDGVGTVSCEPEKNRLYITTLTAQKCTVKVVSA